jgi:hypothetical protein
VFVGRTCRSFGSRARWLCCLGLSSHQSAGGASVGLDRPVLPAVAPAACDGVPLSWEGLSAVGRHGRFRCTPVCASAIPSTRVCRS